MARLRLSRDVASIINHFRIIRQRTQGEHRDRTVSFSLMRTFAQGGRLGTRHPTASGADRFGDTRRSPSVASVASGPSQRNRNSSLFGGYRIRHTTAPRRDDRRLGPTAQGRGRHEAGKARIPGTVSDTGYRPALPNSSCSARKRRWRSRNSAMKSVHAASRDICRYRSRIVVR